MDWRPAGPAGLPCHDGQPTGEGRPCRRAARAGAPAVPSRRPRCPPTAVDATVTGDVLDPAEWSGTNWSYGVVLPSPCWVRSDRGLAQLRPRRFRTLPTPSGPFRHAFGGSEGPPSAARPDVRSSREASEPRRGGVRRVEKGRLALLSGDRHRGRGLRRPPAPALVAPDLLSTAEEPAGEAPCSLAKEQRRLRFGSRVPRVRKVTDLPLRAAYR